jgi:hypothetical protein
VVSFKIVDISGPLLKSRVRDQLLLQWEIGRDSLYDHFLQGSRHPIQRLLACSTMRDHFGN